MQSSNIPPITCPAALLLQGRLPEVSLPRLKAAILLCVGLQRQPIEVIAEHFNVPVPQASLSYLLLHTHGLGMFEIL